MDGRVRLLTNRISKFDDWHSPILLVAGFVTIALVCVRAFVEFVPYEGDSFIAWWPYITGWQNHGMGYVLHHTPSGGKYPLYPLIIRIFMFVFNADYMHALQWTRVFTFLLSFAGVYLLLKEIGLTKIQSWGLTTFVHLGPLYIRTVTLNVQDPLKPGLFALSACFLLRLIRAPQGEPEVRFAQCGFIVSAFGLSMVRSVDLIPLLFFMAALCLQKDPWLKHFTQTWRTRNGTTTYKVIWAFIPVGVLSFLVHAYGKVVGGTWNFSSGESPQIWLKFYFRHLKEDFAKDHSIINYLISAVTWPIIRVINHLYYFIRDFVFQESFLRMQGTYRWVQEFELMGSPTSKVIGLILVASLLVIIISKLGKKRFFEDPLQPFLWGGIGGWAFWTFGLNHYEPRYWALVYLCWLIVMVVPYLKSMAAMRVLMASNLVLLLFLIFSFPASLELAYARKFNIMGWKNKTETICAQSTVKSVAIPEEYYPYSAYRYLADQACPRLEVLRYTIDERGDVIAMDGTRENQRRLDDSIVVLKRDDLEGWIEAIRKTQ